MMIKQLAKQFYNMINNFGLQTYMDMIKAEYNEKGIFAHICYITTGGEKNSVRFDTGLISGSVYANDNGTPQIRKACGENILMMYGIPEEDTEPPLVVLVPNVAKLLSGIGYRRLKKLIDDWPGDSTTEEGLVIVKYSVFK